MFTIGCHLSASNGFLAMGKTALSIGANTFQFFTRNPRGSKAKALDEQDIAAFLAFSKASNFGTLLAHAPYTINPCSKDERTREFARMTLADDLLRMEHLPGNLYNFHPGSHTGQGMETGIDLIAGWPAADGVWRRTVETACSLEPAHVSCYTLIREPGTRVDLWTRKGIFAPPDDDAALAELDFAFDAFGKLGLRRYEISNCARPGAECRHNLGTWRGEDYLGFGEGAHGRLGRARTENGAVVDVLTPERDAVERAIFAFRMREGLDLDAAANRFPALAPRLPEWRATLARLAAEGLVAAEGARWRLTRRGTEVCDAVLADLV